MKQILVTGGAGYIGSHTVVQLIEKGYSPIILDDFRNSDASIIKRLEALTHQQITAINVDICDETALKEALKDYQIDAIIHFAAYKAVGESMALPLKYYRNNVQSLVAILQYALDNHIHQFIFSSSCTVYGDPEGATFVTEQSRTGISTSPYGRTKVVGEQILIDLKASHPSFNFLSLRYFNPVGAHPSGLIGEWPLGKPNNLLPYITQTVIGVQEQLTVFGNQYPTPDGTCIRDYIHVMDLADAHVLGLDYLEKTHFQEVEFINVGTGKGTSVLEFIQTFERLTNEKVNWKFGPDRPGDVPEIYANVEKAHTELGWKAKKNYEDAILDAWRWEQNIRKE